MVFSCFVCFAFYFVCSVLFLPMYTVVYFLFVYNFTDYCHQVETHFQLINIISYIKYSNNPDNVCTNVTMRCVCITIVALEKQ